MTTKPLPAIPDPEQTPFMNVPDAGACLGYGTSQSYAAARAGILPTVKLGPKRLLVPTVELRRLAGL